MLTQCFRRKKKREKCGIADGLARGLDKGRNVLVDEGAALNHDVCAEMAELVHEGASADDGKVVDDDLACELCGIADDDIVTDLAVVGDVAVRHDEAVGAYLGLALRRRAAVDGHALAQGGVVADDGQCVLARSVVQTVMVTAVMTVIASAAATAAMTVALAAASPAAKKLRLLSPTTSKSL